MRAARPVSADRIGRPQPRSDPSRRISAVFGPMAIVTLCFVVAVQGFAQDTAPQPDAVPRPWIPVLPLPAIVRLEPLAAEEIAAFPKKARPDGCRAWVFAASGLDETEVGPALMAFAEQSGGIAKIGGRLCGMGASPNSVNGRDEREWIRGSGFYLYPTQDGLDCSLPLPPGLAGAGQRDTASLSVRAVAARVLVKRTTCTIGGGACRRYQAAYRGVWYAGERGDLTGFAQIAPNVLIVEDRCPWTRQAIVENYSSRLGMGQEWFYRLMNP